MEEEKKGALVFVKFNTVQYSTIQYNIKLIILGLVNRKIVAVYAIKENSDYHVIYIYCTVPAGPGIHAQFSVLTRWM